MKKNLLVVVILLSFLQHSVSQSCNLNCPPNLNVSLVPNGCTLSLTALNLLSNPTPGCTYKLILDYPYGTSQLSPATSLNLSHSGYTMIYRIYDSAAITPTYCWGNLKVNHCNPCFIKTPPVINSFTATAGPYLAGGSDTLSVTATDNVSISKVEFYKYNTLIGTDFTAPYSTVVTFGSTYASENHYWAIVYDNCGDKDTSEYIIITTLFPNCSDGIKNGFETGVDCGSGTGGCPACPVLCSVPTNLVASVYGSQVTMTWAGTATNYQVEIINTTTHEVVVSAHYVTSPYRINIVDGNYKFRVRSACGYTFSDWSGFVPFIVDTYHYYPPACHAPTNLSSWISGNQVTLSWSGSAYQYEIQIDSAYGGSTILTMLVPSSPKQVTLPDGKYMFKVRSVCSGVYSSWSSWVWFTVGSYVPPPPPPYHPDTCAVPTHLTSTVVDRYVTMSWQGTAAQFQIYVESVSTGQSIISAGVNTKYFQASLPPGTYRFKVRGVCGYDVSAWSVWSTFTVQGDHPYYPEDPHYGPDNSCTTPTQLITMISGTQANLKWTGTSLQYQIIVENVTTTETVASAGLNTASFLLNLSSGNYRFRVRSQCGSDYSDWTSWTTFTIPAGASPGSGSSDPNNPPPSPPAPAVCAIPNQLSSTAIGQQIKLSWQGAATLYLIEVLDIVTNVQSIPAQQTGMPFNGTLVNGTYKFRVKAVCSGNQSEWSAWGYFVIGSGAETAHGSYAPISASCDNPVIVKLTHASSTSITLTWIKANATATYLIEVISENAPGTMRYVVDGFAANTLTISGLLASTKYKILIKVNCGSGYSSSVNTTHTITPAPLPYSTGVSKFNCDTPTGLTLSYISSTSVQLSWASVFGVKTYKVETIATGTTPTFTQIQNVLSGSHIVTNLLPGGTYQFKVSAACNFSNSTASLPFVFVMPGNALQSEPRLESREDHPAIGTKVKNISFDLFPNPATVRTNIQLLDRSVESGLIQIIDINGRIVSEIKITKLSPLTTINTSQLNPGLYTVRLSANGTQTIKKLVVQ